MSELKMKELELDISELKALQEKATRSRVKDVISVQVRKLETELVNIKDKIKAETPVTTGEATTKPPESIKRIMECQLKDYCNYQTFYDAQFQMFFQRGTKVRSL